MNSSTFESCRLNILLFALSAATSSRDRETRAGVTRRVRPKVVECRDVFRAGRGEDSEWSRETIREDARETWRRYGSGRYWSRCVNLLFGRVRLAYLVGTKAYQLRPGISLAYQYSVDRSAEVWSDFVSKHLHCEFVHHYSFYCAFSTFMWAMPYSRCWTRKSLTPTLGKSSSSVHFAFMTRHASSLIIKHDGHVST